MENFFIKNVVVQNSRLINPVPRDFGPQYSLLVSGQPELETVSQSDPTEDLAYWLNTNAQTPDGRSIPAPVIIDTAGEIVNTELGKGSVVNLKFSKVVVKGKTYYNLRAVGLISLAPVFDPLDGMFDEDQIADSIAF
jgi:hypothetical protein